jgi:phosphoglycolate phosphatase
MNKIGIIFDLDGTLWDASNQIVIAWNNIIKKSKSYNKVINQADIIKCLGKPNNEIAKTIFNDLSIQEGLKLINLCAIEELNVLKKNSGILYPNLINTLKLLKEKYELFIVSNCQSGYIESFLNYHDLNLYFNDYICSDDTSLPKADNILNIIKKNSLRYAIYVGDTIGDYNAAKQINIPFIYCSYGFGKVYNIKYKINNLSELNDIINLILKDKN